MTDWWAKGYPGGPMVGPPLIRPLYPPDAMTKGKKPSAPGADIEALKRTVSRAGRWPWQPFDEAFSNSFSHGKTDDDGQVRSTGVAGIQRQLGGIDPTGWIGTATWNGLRSIRIPDGLPHAGEPAMDSVAISLLEQYAAEQAGGKTLRERALAKAITQIGYEESPPGTNGNRYGAAYGVDNEPWCAMFVTWCVETTGNSPSFEMGSRYAYVPYLLDDARAGRYGLSVTGDPDPGCCVVYDWQGDGVTDHVGFFEAWTGGRTFTAVEGNTSVSGSQSNGGEVLRRERDAGGSSGPVYFIRWAEPV